MTKTITDIIKPELPNLIGILSLNSDKTNDHIQVLALQELNYLEQQAVTKPMILQCDPTSIILAVKNVLRKNLSLDPSAGLIYVKTRNVNVAKYGEQDRWITILEIQETANGLLSYNRQIGTILDFTNPAVECDASGKTISVSMELLRPSALGPRWEKYSFNEGDFIRWKRASHKENKRSYKANSGKPQPDDNSLNYANPNYTSWQGGLDPEFARAKCIRHSLKKLGSNPNENLGKQITQHKIVVDPNSAYAEAMDNDFTPHEEINTQINETPPQPTSNGGFNANDL